MKKNLTELVFILDKSGSMSPLTDNTIGGFNSLLLFLGANIDAIQTANQFGIGASRAVNYNCDTVGTVLNYKIVSEAVSCFRKNQPLCNDWKKDIEDDFEIRGNNKR